MTDTALPHMTPAEADAAIARAAVKLRAELSMPLSEVEDMIDVEAWLWAQGIDPESATDADVRRAREAVGQPDAFPAETFPVERTLTAHVALTRPGQSVDDCELTELVGRIRDALLRDPVFVARYGGGSVSVTVPLADDLNADSYTTSFRVPV